MTRVLVVDDEKQGLFLVSAVLSAHGFEVTAAADGAQALLKAQQQPPELIISDLLMPVMDGYTLLSHWRADPRLRDIPFIVYTATYTDPADEKLALQLGADAFMLKPTETAIFVATIRRVLAVPHPVHTVTEGEPALLRRYTQALVRKLEQKCEVLATTNRRLAGDLVAREVALRDRDERFRQLAENLDDVVWLEDANTREVIYLSPAFERVFGRPRAASGNWIQAVHEEDRAQLVSSLPQQLLSAWEQEFRVVHADGTFGWVRARTWPMRDTAGLIYRLAGVARDVTAQHSLEAQFRQAQKMEAVGRLAGGIAHDFNNLLSVILSYSNLLRSSTRGRSACCRLKVRSCWVSAVARSPARRTSSRGRRSGWPGSRSSMGAVVLDMEQLLKRLLGEDVELTLRTSAAGGSRVLADASQLEQIVMNLAINARDAMPSGGKLTFEIENAELDAAAVEHHIGLVPGSWVVLTATDTGVGMDVATRARIFEPFFTTKPPGRGTGLGLSTVFDIVKQGRGHVEVRSAPGAGASFRVYLPRTGAELEAPAAAAHVSLRGTETILLVEDDLRVRECTHTILHRNGYHVLDAQDGGEAVEMSESFGAPIHLLLTDVVMPRSSGRDLAERLAPSRPGMKVLYVSGHGDGTIGHHGVFGPGVAFLQKPITPDGLLRKVRSVLAA